jgi:hypothetical protein
MIYAKNIYLVFLVTFDDKQSVHESFKEVMDDLVPDIPTDGAIPLRRKMNSSPARNLQSTDIRTFLEVINNKLNLAQPIIFEECQVENSRSPR